MTPQQVALVAAMEQRIAERLTQLAVPEPQDAAHRLIEDLLRAGWRPWPALVDRAPAPRRAPAPVQREAMTAIRQTLVEKRRARQEPQP